MQSPHIGHRLFVFVFERKCGKNGIGADGISNTQAKRKRIHRLRFFVVAKFKYEFVFPAKKLKGQIFGKAVEGHGIGFSAIVIAKIFPSARERKQYGRTGRPGLFALPQVFAAVESNAFELCSIRGDSDKEILIVQYVIHVIIINAYGHVCKKNFSGALKAGFIYENFR